jgi:FixJ family two-component response regulator
VVEAVMVSIIDDDVWARLGIGELVQSLGYRVSTFESAERFLESDCIRDAACVITDLQMPGMNGIELQQQLKAQGYHTPIILMTAFPSEVHRAQALNYGAAGFLIKPIVEQYLVDCLTVAIDRGHQTHSGRSLT